MLPNTYKTMSKEGKEKVIKTFFKDAFCVDGEVRIFGKEGFEIDSVVELNDSKRGKCYVARVSKTKTQ